MTIRYTLKYSPVYLLMLNLDSSPTVSGRMVRSTLDIKPVEEPTSPEGVTELSTHIDLNMYAISRTYFGQILTALVDRSPWRLWPEVQFPAIASGFMKLRTLRKSTYGPTLVFGESGDWDFRVLICTRKFHEIFMQSCWGGSCKFAEGADLHHVVRFKHVSNVHLLSPHQVIIDQTNCAEERGPRAGKGADGGEIKYSSLRSIQSIFTVISGDN